MLPAVEVLKTERYLGNWIMDTLLYSSLYSMSISSFSGFEVYTFSYGLIARQYM